MKVYKNFQINMRRSSVNNSNMLQLIYKESCIKLKFCHFYAQPSPFPMHLVQRLTNFVISLGLLASYVCVCVYYVSMYACTDVF